jgi:hypothetical protein
MALVSGVKDEVAFRDLDKLLVAAKRPNIAVKVSALPCYTDAPYPYRNLPHARPVRLRCVRPAAHDVGQRFIAPVRDLSRVCDDVHRRNEMAFVQRPRVDHGPHAMRVAWLAERPVMRDGCRVTSDALLESPP